jgi:D-alanine-D-alanine ligase
MQTLRQFQPDLCLNFTDTLRGSSVLAASVPGMFEVMDLPYLGSSSFALSLGTQKHLVQSLLQSFDIPVPPFQLWHDDQEVLDPILHFPLIAKLNEEHGSVGLTEQSVVKSERQLRQVVRELTTTYHQPVIVEQYIRGRELTAVVLQNSQLQVYLAERVYQTTQAQPKILSFDKKWAIELDQPDPLSFRSVTDLPPAVESTIIASVQQAFTVLKMADYGRFDIMVDAQDKYYFIDSNANPSLGPHSSVVRALATYGYNMADVLLFLLAHAARKKVNPIVKKVIPRS